MAGIVSNYESIVVLKTGLGEEGIAALIEKIKNLIEKNGTLSSTDEWGKRKLAYEINDEPDGYYVLFNFTSDGEFPAELDRVYKITDGILRSLIIKK